jgi:hypothetical protein
MWVFAWLLRSDGGWMWVLSTFYCTRSVLYIPAIWTMRSGSTWAIVVFSTVSAAASIDMCRADSGSLTSGDYTWADHTHALYANPGSVLVATALYSWLIRKYTYALSVQISQRGQTCIIGVFVLFFASMVLALTYGAVLLVYEILILATASSVEGPVIAMAEANADNSLPGWHLEDAKHAQCHEEGSPAAGVGGGGAGRKMTFRRNIFS